MKRFNMYKFITLGLLIGLLSCQSEGASDSLKDEVALKHLVDDFSILADQKDVAAQMDLFTEDAVVMSYNEGELGSTLTGKDEIGTAFSNFLGLFETVYHINGQHRVKVYGDSAQGVNYCLVVLISEQDSIRNKLTMGVSYNDTYRKVNDTWLIAKRESHFNWRTNEVMD